MFFSSEYYSKKAEENRQKAEQAYQKAQGIGQDFGPCSVEYWPHLLRAFHQARAFEPIGVPVPALIRPADAKVWPG